MPEPARILVITLRRLGDVLLTTPLIRTVRRGYPARAASTCWCFAAASASWTAIRTSMTS